MARRHERSARPSDLDPVKIWASMDDHAHRTYERAMKYYDNLRLVYDIQTRLEEWTAADEQEQQNQSRAATIDITPTKLSTTGQANKGTTEQGGKDGAGPFLSHLAFLKIPRFREAANDERPNLSFLSGKT